MTEAATAPRVLRADNITPPARTPWGGRAIVDRIKRGLDLGDAAGWAAAGESWEVSVEPSFPSRTADTGELLADVIAAAPEAWLGPAVARRCGGQLPLLVKLLDTADALSVQVHPASDDPALAPGDSGKPEGWYVLAARPGAGIYLGFRDGVDRQDVAACVDAGGALDQLMAFVPVVEGDAFVIEAGTPHAIGAGVTLVEPQVVAPGKRGVTYRFWDWNRRYDAAGRRASGSDGAPRPLHIDRSLAVTRWDAPRGAAGVAAARAASGQESDTADAAGARRRQVIAWPHFTTEVWRGTGALSVPAPGGICAVVCVGGAAELACEAGSVRVRSGQSAVVPASAGAIRATCDRAHLVVTWCA